MHKKRELKFRVWDINDKCFCNFNDLIFFTGDSQSKMLDGIPRYVGTLQSDGEVFYKSGKPVKPIYNRKTERNRYIIQQFTGLMDKNEKPIYEGDIVLAKPVRINKSVFTIIYIAPAFCYQFITEELSIPMFTKMCETDDVEILGNIFQHDVCVGDKVKLK